MSKRSCTLVVILGVRVRRRCGARYGRAPSPHPATCYNLASPGRSPEHSSHEPGGSRAMNDRTTYRVPTDISLKPPGVAFGIVVVAFRDIVERCNTRGIQHRIQEAEWAPPRGEEMVVNQRNNARERRARRARPREAFLAPLVVDSKVDALRRYVGVCAPAGVVQTCVRAALVLHERADSAILI